MSGTQKRAVAFDVQPGDAVLDGDKVRVHRYGGLVRLNHWITAGCLVTLAVSGLALFTPKLFFLTYLFGGGQWTRTIHPWVGLALCVSFALLFRRFWRANLPTWADGAWAMKIIDVVLNHDERLPEVGKYNAGQKFVFWSLSALIMVLVTSGILIWDQYFSMFTSIEVQRFAVLIHALAAIFAICVWIVHVYAAIWVKGTFGAMTRGVVTGGWAWRHHRRWYRELVAEKQADASEKAVGPTTAPPGGKA